MTTPVMRFEVKSEDDLLLPLQVALEQALKEGQSLEVVLAPGTMSGVSVSLRDTTGRVGMVIRGGGPTPTVLDDLSIAIEGADLHLENLVLRGGRRAAPVLDVTMAGSLDMDGVSVLDGSSADRRTDTLVRVVSAYRTGGKPVTIRNGWFIGNRLEERQSLIRFESSHPDLVSQALFENVAFLENVADPVLAPEFTRTLRFRGCSVIGGSGAGPFLDVRNPMLQVTFEGGLLLLPTLGAIARRNPSPPVPTDAWPPVRLKATRLVAGGAEMAGLVLEGTTPLPPSHLATGGDACRREALAGSVPDTGWIARAYGIAD